MVNDVSVSVARLLPRSCKNVVTVNADMVTDDRASGGSRMLQAGNDVLSVRN
jgi:hypothetical protein